MKLKKALCIVLSLLIALMTGVTAFAEEKTVNSDSNSADESSVKISKEAAKSTALKSLKDLLGVEIDENKTQYRAELRPYYEITGNYVWEINWNVSDNFGGMDINVIIDANTGSLCGLRKYDYSRDNQPKVAKITKEQAKKAADDFLDKVNPDIRKNVKYIEQADMMYKYSGYQQVNYNFQYIRLVNGIEFSSNTVSVEVNGVTGKVTSFNYVWNEDIKFPTTDSIVESSKALETFKKSGTFNLAYLPHRNQYYYEQVPKDIKLAYTRTSKDGYMIDAKDGKYVVLPGDTYPGGGIMDLTQTEKDELYKKYAEIKKTGRELGKDEAESIMDGILKGLGYDGYTIDSLRYIQNQTYSDNRGINAWEGQFMKADSAASYNEGGMISIDASTGQITNLYSNYYPETQVSESDLKFSYNECYKKAIDTIAKYYPNRVKDIKTEQVQYSNYYYTNGKRVISPMYNFNFTGIVNGIPYGENNITVAIDARDGKVKELRYYWNDNLVFPDPKNIISIQEAEKIYYEAFKPVLTYTLINKSMDYAKPDMEIRLVYTLRPENLSNYADMIDAVTGKLINYNGEEIKKNADSFAVKIKGHALEKELSIMAYQGIIDLDTFELNKQLTKMDLVKTLVNVRGYNLYLTQNSDELKFTDIKKDTDDYRYLLLAVKYGIIENKSGVFNGSQAITREDLAMYIIKLTNYSGLADAKGIFSLSFKDSKKISSNRYGYVAISKGLGIMDGANGLFRPADKATMVEMAAAVYKAMEYVKPMY